MGNSVTLSRLARGTFAAVDHEGVTRLVFKKLEDRSYAVGLPMGSHLLCHRPEPTKPGHTTVAFETEASGYPPVTVQRNNLLGFARDFLAATRTPKP